MVKGAVLGGGLLGLEAAGALQALGARTTVLQVGTHLMSAQVDLGGGEALRRLINQLGVGVRLNAMTTQDQARTAAAASVASSWPTAAASTRTSS